MAGFVRKDVKDSNFIVSDCHVGWLCTLPEL